MRISIPSSPSSPSTSSRMRMGKTPTRRCTTTGWNRKESNKKESNKKESNRNKTGRTWKQNKTKISSRRREPTRTGKMSTKTTTMRTSTSEFSDSVSNSKALVYLENTYYQPSEAVLPPRQSSLQSNYFPPCLPQLPLYRPLLSLHCPLLPLHLSPAPFVLFAHSLGPCQHLKEGGCGNHNGLVEVVGGGQLLTVVPDELLRSL